MCEEEVLSAPMTYKLTQHLDNLDHIRETISKYCKGLNVKASTPISKRSDGYFSSIETESAVLGLIRYGTDVDVFCEQSDTYGLVIPFTGRSNITYQGYERLGYEEIKLVPPDTRLNMWYSGDCHHFCINFKRTRLVDDLLQPLISATDLDHQRYVLEKVRAVCLDFVVRITHLFSRVDLETHANNLVDDIFCLLSSQGKAETEHTTKPVPTEFLDVLNFMSTQHSWVYSIKDLADLLGVSKRRVYIEFQRYTGCSPYRYYLNTKLSRARMELLRGEGESNITEIALSNGFEHLGRFASNYRLLYGETPSQTVLRSKNNN